MIHNIYNIIIHIFPDNETAVNISLTSDVTGNIAYHGQMVTLVCTIVANHEILITWRSLQYIGADILQLLSTYQDGHTVSNPQNPATVATLINSTRSRRMVTVIAQLQLRALAMHPHSRVSCRANGHEPVISSFGKSDK